jgi:hypothetical protein
MSVIAAGEIVNSKGQINVLSKSNPETDGLMRLSCLSRKFGKSNFTRFDEEMVE